MKANIDASGKLTVIGERPLESYALKKWLNDWDNSESTLYIEVENQYNPSAVSLFFVDKK